MLVRENPLIQNSEPRICNKRWVSKINFGTNDFEKPSQAFALNKTHDYGDLNACIIKQAVRLLQNHSALHLKGF